MIELRFGDRATTTLECALRCDETDRGAVYDAAVEHAARFEGKRPGEQITVEIAQMPECGEIEHPVVTFTGPVERVAALFAYHVRCVAIQKSKKKVILGTQTSVRSGA